MRDSRWRGFMDWSMTGRPLLVLLTVALTAAVAVVTLAERLQQTREQEQSVRVQLQSAEQRLLSARSNLEYIRSYYEKYGEFKQAGIIAAEDRLQWIDAVRAVADEIRLPKVDYFLNPRRQLDANQGGRQAKLWVSTMNLKLSLLHEGDLLVFMNKLEQTAKGFFDIDFCRLDRQAKDVTYSARAVNVVAECDLQWFTVGDDQGV